MVVSFALQITFAILFTLRGNVNAVYVVFTTMALLAIKLWLKQLIKPAILVSIVCFLLIGLWTSKDVYDWILVLGNICYSFHVFFNAKDIAGSKKASFHTKISQYFLLAFNLGWIIFNAKREIYGAMWSAVFSAITTAISIWWPKKQKKD